MVFLIILTFNIGHDYYYKFNIFIAMELHKCITRHTHSVNASCSYEVHEDIICMHTNGSLEEWHCYRVIVHMAYQKIQSNYGLYIASRP